MTPRNGTAPLSQDVLRDRFAGALVGKCVGDALGFLVEGQPARMCSALVEQLIRPSAADPSHDLEFGQYTDDSQLARELLDSMVARRRFDADDYAARIADIFRTGRIVGQGVATARAAQRLIRGVPWQSAGEAPPSAGNGTAMRAAPVGLLFHDSAADLARVARDQGLITHRDPRCTAGSIATARAVALLLRGAPLDRNAFVADLADAVTPVHAGFGAAIRPLAGLADAPPATAYREILALSQAESDAGQPYDWPGISPFVIPTVLWSLYSFLASPDDYVATICTSIAVGGDVDTTAAIAGALAGAHLGLAGIPAHWADKVHDDGGWRRADLVSLANRAADLIAHGQFAQHPAHE